MHAGDGRKIFIVKWNTAMRVLALAVVHNPEMPTAGNLKSGDSFFCIPPPPPPPPEYQWSTPLP